MLMKLKVWLWLTKDAATVIKSPASVSKWYVALAEHDPFSILIFTLEHDNQPEVTGG